MRIGREQLSTAKRLNRITIGAVLVSLGALFVLGYSLWLTRKQFASDERPWGTRIRHTTGDARCGWKSLGSDLHC